MPAQKQKTLLFSVFSLILAGQLLTFYSSLPANPVSEIQRAPQWVSFMLILLSVTASCLLFWRFHLQPVSGLFLLSFGFLAIAALESVGVKYPAYVLFHNSRFIAIPAFGKMICASTFLFAAFRIDLAFLPGKRLRGVSNDLFIVVMASGAGLISSFYLPLRLPAGENLITGAMFFAAIPIFFVRFVRTGHKSSFWFSLSALFLFFGVLFDALGRSQIGPFLNLTFLESFLAFVVIPIGLLEDNRRFLDKERLLRGELERSVIETQTSLVDLQSLLQSCQVGRGIIDQHGKIKEASGELLEITGYSQREIKGKPLTFLFGSNRGGDADKIPGNGKLSRFDTQIRSKSGNLVFCQVAVKPVMKGTRFNGAMFLVQNLSTWKEEEVELRRTVQQLTQSLASQEKQSEQIIEELEDNKAFHNIILSAVQKIIMVVNNKGQCVYVNSYGLDLMGFSAKELSLIKVPPFFKDIGNVKADYGESIKVELDDYEHTLKFRDGSSLDCIWQVRFLFNRKGKRIGVFGIGAEKVNIVSGANSDIAGLSRFQEQINRVMTGARIFALDGNPGKFLDIMGSYLRNLGWQSAIFILRDPVSEELLVAASAGPNQPQYLIDDLLAGKSRKYLRDNQRLGRSFLVNHADSAKSAGESILTRVGNSKEEIGWMICSNSKSGAKPDELMIKSIESAAGYAAVLFTTIHELFERAQEIKVLRNKDQIKTEFLSHLSHELRTPLSAILSISEGLLKKLAGGLNPEQQKQIQLVQKNGRTLLQFVNDLLEMMRMDAGESELSFSYFQISNLLYSVTSSVESLCRDKGLKLETKISRGVPERVFGDKERISSILNNYLSNAIKFTERGKIDVITSLEQKGSRLRISVQDTGPGIPSGQLNEIFEEYRQLDPSKAGTRGSGLGLPIAKKNAELLGGQVEVISKKGRGSRFDVIFPVTRIGEIFVAGEAFARPQNETRLPDLAAEGTGNAPKRTPGRKSVSKKRRSATTTRLEKNGARVLLIDDDEGVRYAVKFSLEDAGYQVIASASSKEGIRLARKEHPAIILMDMVLPGGLDGLQATRKLKSMKTTMDIPIIATTAKASRTDKLKALEAGCSDYLVKPFDFNDLLKRLKRQIK